MFSLQELLELNRQGLILSPGEDLLSYEKRVAACWRDKTCAPSLQKASLLVRRLFDIAPSWVEVVYSNKELPFWHGAQTWIEEEEEEGRFLVRKVSIQLKERLEGKEFLFGYYPIEEILAHELAHAGRSALESRYEELFAYKTSKNPFRRWLGPLFSGKSAIGLLFITLFQPIALFLWPEEAAWQLLILALNPLFILFLLAKNALLHRTLNRAEAKCREILADPSQALHLLYRLSDEEIAFFSRQKKEAVLASLHALKSSDKRWELLHAAYPILSKES
ncbi:MAG: hypothetical protein K0S07_143 [Chlamydiales bacterium]|jgi:hypothetical protein|nr:hypothetical protein [Chlamydiales bacterium]